MSPLILQAAFIPVATLMLGGLIAAVKTPSKSVSSFTQHFAAGVVFAAVAIELLPRLSNVSAIWPMTLGFVLGSALMILLKHILGGHGHEEGQSSATPWNLIVAIGVDLFIDGLLIGTAFVAGSKGGVLVAIALAIEILFLSISLTASLKQKNHHWFAILATLTIMSLLLISGSMLGSALISNASAIELEIILSFGVAALLYLVTEELLEEAHETEDTPVITSSFFAGFLIIFLLNHSV